MERVKELLDDALALAGVGAITYGAWAVYAPAGWVVGGAFAVAAATASARARARKG